ncbi:hypothetical protein EW145_g1753 [Phellinidium pouzarii]|uniref:FAD-binding domain-containing protein n=1 Tax=Phellinidium pouzarii TaxID=167371 RepID=A0A4S4LDS1_9AGAM|nr:hypothetical protein EW145_g1753 [Phellinidium pouzarii]
MVPIINSEAVMQSPQVLIVGSGPAGLVLALALLKNSVPTRIIEKDTEHHVGERGSGIMPRTLEIEHFLGVYDDVQKAGVNTPTLHVFDPNDPYRIMKSAELIEHVEPTPTFPITKGVMLGQWRHQAILRKHIEALGGEIELGSTLIDFKQDESGVTAEILKTTDSEEVTERSRFAYIVGADGARSAVRKALGVTFAGETREEGKMYIVDARIEGLEGEKDVYLWKRHSSMVSPRHTVDPRVFQMIFAGPEVDFASLRASNSVQAVQNEFERISHRTDLKITSITWQGEWRPNIRMADHFCLGRVFLIGDAAHTHSPTGGQGLNSSIQDAFNLAWKLSLVLKDHARPTLLDSYEAERVPVTAEMLKITTVLYNRSFSTHAQHALERAEAFSPSTKIDSELHWYRGRKLFQLDLNYRWSSIVFDERFERSASDVDEVYGVAGHDTRAGDRAPDAPGLAPFSAVSNGSGVTLTRIFDILNPAMHTALIFVSLPALGKARTLLRPLNQLSSGLVHMVLIFPTPVASSASLPSLDFDCVFEDTKGYAFQGYGVGMDDDVPTIVLIRPDGMVGAFVRTVAGVEKYLKAVFGSVSS